MGYFSNGSEGDDYRSKYCENCAHCPKSIEESECVVWEMHLDFNYELCNEEKNTGKIILDSLIPIRKDGIFCDQCKMFIQIKSEGQTNF